MTCGIPTIPGWFKIVVGCNQVVQSVPTLPHYVQSIVLNDQELKYHPLGPKNRLDDMATRQIVILGLLDQVKTY